LAAAAATFFSAFLRFFFLFTIVAIKSRNGKNDLSCYAKIVSFSLFFSFSLLMLLVVFAAVTAATRLVGPLL
jgi:hypothetical protein